MVSEQVLGGVEDWAFLERQTARRVLVVEPDAALHHAIGGELTPMGFEIRAVATVRQALGSIDRKGPPDLVLIDCDLEGTNPLEALVVLRVRARRHLPAGFLSRGTRPAVRLRGCPVMGPPFRAVRLLAFIDEIFLLRRSLVGHDVPAPGRPDSFRPGTRARARGWDAAWKGLLGRAFPRNGVRRAGQMPGKGALGEGGRAGPRRRRPKET
jgi:CheY-like chemotaxis protein